MKLRFALAFLSFAHTICCSRVITVEEEVIEEPLANESATAARDGAEGSTPKRPNKAGLAGESEHDGAADGPSDDDAAPCRALRKREACEQCCQLGAPDPVACVASAACADKPSASEPAGEPPAGEDCRTTGCAEGETCSACWTGYACLPSGWTC